MAAKKKRPAAAKKAEAPAVVEDTNTIPMRVLIGVTGVLLSARVYASSHIGFGDSEALYASYAAHPQPAYLDHPGLIGQVASALGSGGVPTPSRAHLFSLGVAAIVPWLVVWIAQLAGARKSHAMAAGLATCVVPEIAVGLFALTPDLLLAPLWLGAIGLVIAALEKKRTIHLLAAGLVVGVASSAKVSGLLLFPALAYVYARSDQKKTPWPWAGLVAGAIVFAPIVTYEAHNGWPMLKHRFVETQTGAGIALKNLGQLVGGQLLYLSPVIVALVFIIGRDLVRHRNDDNAARVLFATFAIPIVPLLLLSIWSPVAEPHWIAPPLLALPIHAARRACWRAKVVKIGLGVAAGFSVLVYAWVLLPDVSSKLLPASVDPKIDISNELYGWPSIDEPVREQRMLASTPGDLEGENVVIVGPHWTICAQLQVQFPTAKVGCATPAPDDFDGWLPRAEWRKADAVLWVTDNRFPNDGAKELPLLNRYSQSKVRTMRGGKPARTFELYLYSRRAQAAL
jgi:hypothetical protein